MKTIRVFLPILLTAALAAAWAQSAAPGRLYNPATETTLKGTIDSVSTVTGRQGWNGLHFKLQENTCDIHVGPASYIDAKGFSFSKGDEVEVIASKVQWNATDACIAREITKEGKVLELRDHKGYPLWSRSRWRSQ